MASEQMMGLVDGGKTSTMRTILKIFEIPGVIKCYTDHNGSKELTKFFATINDKSAEDILLSFLSILLTNEINILYIGWDDDGDDDPSPSHPPKNSQTDAPAQAKNILWLFDIIKDTTLNMICNDKGTNEYSDLFLALLFKDDYKIIRNIYRNFGFMGESHITHTAMVKQQDDFYSRFRAMDIVSEMSREIDDLAYNILSDLTLYREGNHTNNTYNVLSNVDIFEKHNVHFYCTRYLTTPLCGSEILSLGVPITQPKWLIQSNHGGEFAFITINKWFMKYTLASTTNDIRSNWSKYLLKYILGGDFVFRANTELFKKYHSYTEVMIMGTSEKVRINFDIERSKLVEIKKLMEAAGVTTQKELFDSALTLARWMMRQRKEGKVVGALSENDRFTEIDMPMLENASHTKVTI